MCTKVHIVPVGWVFKTTAAAAATVLTVAYWSLFPQNLLNIFPDLHDLLNTFHRKKFT